MRPSSRLLLLLVVAAAMTCAFANDTVESLEAPVKSEAAEAKMVKRAIELKTLKVEEAQAKRAKARKVLRQAGKAIPAGLEKGSLVKMMNRKDHQTVVKEVTALNNKPLADTEHSVKGRKARIIAARVSRAKARKVLKKNGRHVPYILQKGSLAKVTKMADKAVLITHIQNGRAFRSENAETKMALDAAAADTVSAILDLVPPQEGKEDSSIVKTAKKLRAQARAELKAKGKPIPFVLRAGTLDKLMTMKDKATIVSHLVGYKAKLAAEKTEEDKAKHLNAVKKQRAEARAELRSQNRTLPYVLEKNTLKVMMGLKGAEKEEVLKRIERANKEVTEVDNRLAAEKAKKEAQEAAMHKKKATWMALKAVRAKARKEMKANGKPVPFFLVKNSMQAMEMLTSKEKIEIQKQMQKLEAEMRADKNHTPYTNATVEKKQEAKLQAMKDEDEALRAQKALDDPSSDKSALKKAILDFKAQRKDVPKSTGDPVKDAVRAASQASVSALSNVLPKNPLVEKALNKTKKGDTPKSRPTIDGCRPKDPNMKYLSAVAQQLSTVSAKAQAAAKDSKQKVSAKMVAEGETLRRKLADMIADNCRDVPMVLHGEGLDDIKQVAAQARSFFAYMKTDLKLKAKQDLKTRVKNEMKRGADTCTAKNKGMSDSDTVIDCNKRVWARIQYMLEEYEAGPMPK